MKNTLLIIAMVIGSYCYGQKKDSVIATTKGDITGTTFVTAQPGYKTGRIIEYNTKQDTLKVLMLVCDTAKYFQYDSAFSNEMNYIPDSQWHHLVAYYTKQYVKSVWWIYGYEVRETCGHTLSTYPIGTTCPHFTYYSYLDQNKKPLSKSIVVWITKEIK